MRKTQATRITRRHLFATAFGISASFPSATTHAVEIPIGVNFTEAAASQITALESAGAPGFEQTNWNNRGRWGDPSILNDGTGAATPVSMKWDATAMWANNADPAVDANHKLMKDYEDSNGAAIATAFNGIFGTDDDKPTILVNGLGTWLTDNNLETYSVVIYSDGDSGNGERAAKVWLASTDPSSPVNGDPGLGGDLTARIDIVDASNWGDNPTFTKSTASSGTGNYTVFSGLTAASFYIRLDEAGIAPLRCPINGFQIIGTDVSALVDTDNDGLPDSWETNFALDPNDDGSIDPVNGANGDPDGDTLTNLQEYNAGVASTNPRSNDSDGDGLLDNVETRDGSFVDAQHTGSDPSNPDTDDDGLPDLWEVVNLLDPNDDGTTNPDFGADGDPDGEFLPNLLEFERKTDPHVQDTDGDNYDDLAEDNFGSWGGVDFTGTSPTNADSDADGIPDGEENPDEAYVAGVTYGTDPNLSDTDGDGTNDRWEFLLGTDPSQEGSNLPTVPVANGGFELPDVGGTFVNAQPDLWTYLPGPDEGGITFLENTASVGFTGGDGLQYLGIQSAGAAIYQDTGIQIAADTTYVIDLSGAVRAGYDSGLVQFGLYAGSDIGTPLPSYPGWMDLAGILPESGNPDADGVIGKLRDASAVTTIGTGALGRPFSLVTGTTPPAGNLIIYVRQENGLRVNLDKVRIIAVPNSIDADNDGLPDGWELANNLSPEDNGTTDPINGPGGDPDGDTLTNAQELALGSNPRNADTDGDQLNDNIETASGNYMGPTNTGTSPLLTDSDGDGFDDFAETTAGTDPNDAEDFPITALPKITSAELVGTAFELSIENLTPARTYTLSRGTTLQDFAPVGDPITGVTTYTFTDDPALIGKGFYRIEEVEP